MASILSDREKQPGAGQLDGAAADWHARGRAEVDVTAATGCRVLILDDDPVAGAVLEAAATPHASYVERLLDAEHFRQRVMDGFDVVFLDVMLPGADAIDLLNEFSNEASTFPLIIFVSGLDAGILHSAVAYARKRGFSVRGALEKPIRLAEVGLMLGQLTRRRTASNAPSNGYAGDASECLSALRAGEFFLRYQPQVDLRTRRVVGAEALIRWAHPALGELVPASFLPLLEEEATARELAEFVLNNALRDMTHHEAFASGLTVSVNIHASVLRSEGFADWVVQALQVYGTPSSSLSLEATEAAIVGEDAETLHALVKLRMAGVGLSIDDFGTGHSTLAQLWRMPVNEIKLDRSYVATLATSAKSRALVQGMVHMATGMKARVVAEGIESEEVAAELLALDCGHGQGYLFARPLLPTELATFAARHDAR